MQKKCSKCGRSIKEAGRLVKVTWLGFRAPLCKKCRTEIQKKKKTRFDIAGFIRRKFNRGVKTVGKKKK